jgi:pimeloyl-ACP methyl ester carboxylesterase
MTVSSRHTSTPIMLIPGYWLGSWAFDSVTARLNSLGHPAYGVTLPGLASTQVSRESIHFSQHVEYVTEMLKAVHTPVVLVAHSGAGAVATAVADAIPQVLKRIIYVDSGPVSSGMIPRPDLSPKGIELPFPGFDALRASGASTVGLSSHEMSHIAARAVPHPVGAICEPVELHHEQRHHVPATMVCCSVSSATVRQLASAGQAMFAPLNDLTDLTLLDLRTGHWPMFSESYRLANLIAQEADRP